jgi:hypothetical protein
MGVSESVLQAGCVSACVTCLSSGSGDALSLELVRQNQISLPQKALVLRDFVLGNVKLAVVAHDRIKHYLVSRCQHDCIVYAPQKKLPGFVPALNLMSRPILPTARTPSALGT